MAGSPSDWAARAPTISPGTSWWTHTEPHATVIVSKTSVLLQLVCAKILVERIMTDMLKPNYLYLNDITRPVAP